MNLKTALFDRIAETACTLGATKAAVIPASEVKTDLMFRDMCAANACGMYGKCWTCPPDIGDAEALIAELSGFDNVLVYQYVGTLEDSYDFEGMTDAKQAHGKISKALRTAICDPAIRKTLHLGAGGCGVCAVCAKREGKPCRAPSLAMSSLEAYCIHVSELAKSVGMRYINGENTVTYFGAVFFSL